GGAAAGRRLVLARAVAARVQDVVVAVEVHVDLAAVAARDLDLVVALLVLELGARDAPAADVVDRDRARLVERGSRDRLSGARVAPAPVVVASRTPSRGA